MNSDSHHSRSRSDFIGELNDAIRKNPVPAALIGVGFLWLMTGGRNVLLGGASHSLLSGMGEATKRSGHAAYRGARFAGAQTSAGAARMGESAFHLGAEISDRISSAAEAVSNAGGSIATHLTHAANDVAESAWSKQNSESPFRTNNAPVIKRVQDSLAEIFAQQPLLLGAVGIAIGAGIAASLPRTEVEDRLIGPTADAARDRGEVLWEEAKKRGTDIASRGLEEAKRQGITPQAAADVARTIGSKVAGVADRASKDVVDRIKGESPETS